MILRESCTAFARSNFIAGSISIIKVQEKDGRQIVSARELHEFLGSKQQFADWIKNRIDKYNLIEGQDYVTFHSFMKRSKTTEYALTIDAAKELAMVEGNERGHFITVTVSNSEQLNIKIDQRRLNYIFNRVSDQVFSDTQNAA